MCEPKYEKQDERYKKKYERRIDDVEYMLTKPDWLKKLQEHFRQYYE